jgi:hypothetical protein
MTAPVSKPDRGYSGETGEFRSPKDFRLLECALSKGWRISQELRAKAIASIESVLSNPNSDSRLRLAAIRVLILADSVNVRLENVLLRAGADRRPQLSVNLTATIEEYAAAFGANRGKDPLGDANESRRIVESQVSNVTPDTPGLDTCTHPPSAHKISGHTGSPPSAPEK